MKFASLIHRASRVDSSLQHAPDVVRMATRNGAAALGHQTGQLTRGRKADVILVNLKSQMFTPLMPENKEHLFSHLVFAANGSCVDTTIIDGKIVMENRQLTTVDEQKVLSEANDAFRRILDRMVVPPPA
jgi:5-methylthioadenosine/S-adenosylhomocysteine deaminase